MSTGPTSLQSLAMCQLIKPTLYSNVNRKHESRCGGQMPSRNGTDRVLDRGLLPPKLSRRQELEHSVTFD